MSKRRGKNAIHSIVRTHPDAILNGRKSKRTLRSHRVTQAARLPAPGDTSRLRSLGRLEQCSKTRNLFLQIVAQLGSRQEEVPICLAAVQWILVRDDDQSNVLAGCVAERNLHDKFPDGIFGAVPAGIKESDPGFD